MKHILLCALLVAAVGTLPAAAQPSYDRVLIPIFVTSAPGAFGSVWTSDVILRNTTSSYVDVQWPTPCLPYCNPPLAQPFTTYYLHAGGEPAAEPGLVVNVQHPSEQIAFSSRVFDETRQGETYGTEIPVVREKQFTDQPLSFLGLPTASRFRLLLRIYDLNTSTRDIVTVRASYSGYDFGVVDVPLILPTSAAMSERLSKPSFVSLTDFPALFPRMVGPTGQLVSGFDLTVTPKTPGAKIWAFVTVTHNETQHVTTVTPQ